MTTAVLTPYRPPAYWPDGLLKHQWISSRRMRAQICAWCGRTRGGTTIGKPCQPDEAGRQSLSTASKGTENKGDLPEETP